MIHYLKISPRYFTEVKAGIKKFELRKNDRGFSVGDKIILREFNGLEFTGAKIRKDIIYILCGVPEHGLNEDFVILGIN